MRRTPLFKFHKEYGRLGEYAGFEMPLYYKAPLVEHMSVRNNVGIFDVSHMGRLLVTGHHVTDLLNRLLTNNCALMEIMKGRHAFLCNSSGGIIDDVMIFRLAEDEFFMIVNAVNREKDLVWIDNNADDLDARTRDLAEKVPMIAVQGPRASRTLQRIFGSEINRLVRLESSWLYLDESKVLVSRTGYTGEDGFEIYLFENGNEDAALNLWKMILDAGKEFEIKACGLAARDTLRLEAGFCLYGNELDENITPIEAGLKFGVKFDQRDFMGKDMLLRQMTEGVDKTRIGLKMNERGIPRKGMKILKDHKEIGFVTSGTLSPILNTGIAMGYVPPNYASLETKVDICIRGRLVEAEIVDFPFYDKNRYGWKRKIKH